MSLGDLYKEFIVKPGLRPSTRALYAQQWEKHLKPALGSALVTKITKAHVNRLISQLNREGVRNRDD